jgi:hypothetical protein
VKINIKAGICLSWAGKSCLICYVQCLCRSDSAYHFTTFHSKLLSTANGSISFFLRLCALRELGLPANNLQLRYAMARRLTPRSHLRIHHDQFLE